MFSFLSDVPGTDELRAIVRKVDTARHHGVPSGCVLELDLQSVPPESSSFDPLAMITGGGKPLLLREAVAAIRRAAKDDRVAGLIARVQVPAAAPGPVQELREAIVAFSDVKPSLAWAETYPGHDVVLPGVRVPRGVDAAVGNRRADRLRDQCAVPARRAGQGRHPGPVHRARRIQVGGQHVHPGELHRSRTARPTAGSSRACTTRCLRPSPHHGTSTPADIDALADKAPLLRDDAVTGRLVDRIGFRDEAYARIAELAGAADASTPTIPMPRRGCTCRAMRARALPAPSPSLPGRKSKPTIAVVTLAGPIVSGRGGRSLSPFGTSSAGGDTIAAALREAGADDDVSAVVLRVDSPGGSVTGLGNHLARGGSAQGRRQADRRLDGCGGGLRRLLRVDGRRRDRRQRRHAHRVDRRRHRQVGRQGPQGAPRHRLGLGAHQSRMPMRGR